MNTNQRKKNNFALLETDEFTALLDAAEAITRAQGNIYQINKTTGDLRTLINMEKISLLRKENPFYNVVNCVETLIRDIGEK